MSITAQHTDILAIENEQELACDRQNGNISSDLEWP